LIFGPHFEYWQIFEEVDFLIFLPILNFSQALFEILSIKDSQKGVLDSSNSGCSWRIIKQCPFSKTASSLESVDINKPLLLYVFEIAVCNLFALLLFVFMHL
jgi:hypothetical protein